MTKIFITRFLQLLAIALSMGPPAFAGSPQPAANACSEPGLVRKIARLKNMVQLADQRIVILTKEREDLEKIKKENNRFSVFARIRSGFVSIKIPGNKASRKADILSDFPVDLAQSFGMTTVQLSAKQSALFKQADFLSNTTSEYQKKSLEVLNKIYDHYPREGESSFLSMGTEDSAYLEAQIAKTEDLIYFYGIYSKQTLGLVKNIEHWCLVMGGSLSELQKTEVIREGSHNNH